MLTLLAFHHFPQFGCADLQDRGRRDRQDDPPEAEQLPHGHDREYHSQRVEAERPPHDQRLDQVPLDEDVDDEIDGADLGNDHQVAALGKTYQGRRYNRHQRADEGNYGSETCQETVQYGEFDPQQEQGSRRHQANDQGIEKHADDEALQAFVDFTP